MRGNMNNKAPLGMIFFFVFFVLVCALCFFPYFSDKRQPVAGADKSYVNGQPVQGDTITSGPGLGH